MTLADLYSPMELDESLNTELLMPTGGEFVQAKVIKRKRDADESLNTELLMPTGGEFVQAKVIKRKRDADDNPMGK
jgi:hypothetical protein